MKFLLAILAYALIAVVLGAGILLLIKGNFWVLAAGAALYLLAFARFGCLPPKSHH